MFGFLTKRPGLAVLTFVGLFLAGGVMAHQTNPAPQKQRVRQPSPPAARAVAQAPAPWSWEEQASLEAAREEDGQLVQRLPDGGSIRLTVDPKLQRWAQGFLAENELPYGAMTLFELSTGKVLVLAGHSSEAQQLPGSQLCLTPWAPAASVFKLITSSALLSKGVPADTQVCYHGGLHGLQREHILDNPGRDSTCRTLSYALAKSVNPVMGKLALKYLDQRSMEAWARRYGFGQPIPFELPADPSRAVIPADRLERARVAAGFWHTEISPLHGAVIASVAARDGLLAWPHVVASVKRPDGVALPLSRPAATRVLSARVAQQLRQMMLQTTTMGTAQQAFAPGRGAPPLPEGLQVAGKTGSLSRSDPFLHYNWFVGFAPADDPQVAFAVLLGNPARWRVKAHSSARALLSQYFASRAQPQKVARLTLPEAPPRPGAPAAR